MVLEGQVEIVRQDTDGEDIIASFSAGGFLGELSLLTGQRPYLTGRVVESGRLLRIRGDEFRRLMSAKPDLADLIFNAFSARREHLRAGRRRPGHPDRRLPVLLRGHGPTRLRHPFSPPHEWIDLEDSVDPDVLLAGIGLRSPDTPAVITPTAVLRHTSPGEFAELLGLTFRPVPGTLFDLVVIGTGPAGLASAVYGASEGLDTVALDAFSVGGQAGASSRIENYVGFPNGVSGEDLVSRTAIQAQRLGARLNAPCVVAGLRPEYGFHVVTLGGRQ